LFLAKEDGMHRNSTKRLTAFIVSLVACLVLVGNSALYSAQSATTKASTRAAKQGGPTATKAANSHKAPVAKATGFSQKKSARKRATGDANTPISGTVTDGSGHGWPLYAQLEFTSASTDPFDVYTDPVTGQYQAELFSGIDYTVTVIAFAPGYNSANGAFTTAGTPVIQDWSLTVNATTCNALGYEAAGFNSVFSESFDSGELPDGWSVEQTSGEATWYVTDGADPCGDFKGNDTGGEGPYAIINSNCFSDITNTDDSSLVTPSVDASELPALAIQWANEFVDQGQGSSGSVDVSTDGGTTWNSVWSVSGEDLFGPGTILADLTGAAGQADVKARFHYTGFWAWWWQVDNVVIGQPLCDPVAGGLVVGNVTDGNENAGVGGATVANLTDASSTTTSGDGFYVLFSAAGPQSLLASKAGYESDGHNVTVFNNAAVRRDFVLQAAHLDASPRPVAAVINPDSTTNKTMTVSNSGEPSADFKVIELNAPLTQNLTAGFASKAQRQQALARLPMDGKQRNDRATSAAGLAPLVNPHPAPRRPHVASGASVIASYPTDITFGWGVATNAGNVWLSNLGVAGGDDLDYEYSNAGALTGNTIDDSTWIGAWAADGANNPISGMIWRVNVGGDNCLYELNPTTHTATGNSICGDFAGTSQRGMAYDAIGDTYFVGGWNEGVVYHVDSEGNSIDSAFVALPISGMAYNANNGHLLVMSNTDAPEDITVLDAFNNYAVLDAYAVLDNGTPIFGGFEQAGMEFDCLGNLWMVNQATQVLYKVASDDGSLCEVDIPWLTVDPTEGTVAGNGGTSPVTLTYNSAGLLPGLKQAQLQISSDTPYTVPGVPVTMTVLFNDVPEGSFAWNFIYGAAGAGIMRGCSYYSFCPGGTVSRADMAGYLERAIHGPLTPPPVYLGEFTDVFFNDYNANYIQGLVNDGITAGCGDGTTFCPDAPNTRAQMSVFIWKGEHGDQAPPACTGIFTDVPCPSGFAVDYIEGLYNEGVTAGCGGGNFCPNANITNAQMSVFLVKGFNIPYLP
jgi:S-layer homology domain